jgi:hypothetical protein
MNSKHKDPFMSTTKHNKTPLYLFPKDSLLTISIYSFTGESHLVCVPCGVAMPEALLSSAICRSSDGGDNTAAMAAVAAGAGGGQGGGVDFGFDPNDDPELAMVGVCV